jgi:hypothetical protein
MQRTTHVAASLAIVVIAYWLYALLAVPWIEPPAQQAEPEQITAEQRQRGEALPDIYTKELQGLFPPGAWELKNPKILDLDNDRAKLLFREYRTLSDGRMRLSPLTLVLPYEGAADKLSFFKPPPERCCSSTSRWTWREPKWDVSWRAKLRAMSPFIATGSNPAPRMT